MRRGRARRGRLERAIVGEAKLLTGLVEPPRPSIDQQNARARADASALKHLGRRRERDDLEALFRRSDGATVRRRSQLGSLLPIDPVAAHEELDVRHRAPAPRFVHGMTRCRASHSPFWAGTNTSTRPAFAWRSRNDARPRARRSSERVLRRSSEQRVRAVERGRIGAAIDAEHPVLAERTRLERHARCACRGLVAFAGHEIRDRLRGDALRALWHANDELAGLREDTPQDEAHRIAGAVAAKIAAIAFGCRRGIGKRIAAREAADDVHSLERADRRQAVHRCAARRGGA